MKYQAEISLSLDFSLGPAGSNGTLPPHLCQLVRHGTLLTITNLVCGHQGLPCLQSPMSSLYLSKSSLQSPRSSLRSPSLPFFGMITNRLTLNRDQQTQNKSVTQQTENARRTYRQDTLTNCLFYCIRLSCAFLPTNMW